MSEFPNDKNIITQDDSSLQKQSQTPDAAQSSMQSDELDFNNNNHNSDSDTHLHSVATATNLTQSFNNQSKSETDVYYQHPYMNAFMNYSNSVPQYTQHSFAMAATSHTHLKPNNTFAAPIADIEVNSKYQPFDNINNSQLTESPLTNSSFHSNQNEDTDLSNLKIPITPTFETKEQKRQRKELQRVIKHNKESEWLKNITQDSIVLTEDNEHIESIGEKQISSINCNLLTRVARKFHSVIPNSKRKKEDILKIIINTVLSNEYTTNNNFIKTPKRNKNSSRTRPKSMKSDNTFYRIINTITCEEGRIHFMKTREQSTRLQLDAVDGHISLWQQLHNLFLSDKEDINEINCPNDLVGFNVDLDCANKFDRLSSSDFRLATCHLTYLYHQSRNRYTQSGSHSHYSDFINGKPYLLYLHNSLERIGNRNLSNCVFPSISEEAKLTSSNSHGSGITFTSSSSSSVNSKRKRSSHALNLEERKKKLDILDSSKLTMQCILEKNKSFQVSVSKEAIIEVRDKIFDTKESIIELKDKIKNSFSNFDNERLKRETKHLKKKLKMFESNYNSLKEQIPDYESPSSESSCSLAGGYDFDDN